MVISVVVLAVEVVAAVAGNSVALLADAAHVFGDVSGLALSLFAVRLAARPRTDERTFGLYRLEILAATANALLLLAMGTFVIVEGIRRLAAPPEVDSPLVAAVATLALLANLVSLRLLAAGRAESLTVRGAYLEVLGDLLGASAVLASALVTTATGWLQADALASIFIGLLIIPRTLALLRDSVDVLLEASPKGIDVTEVRRHILEAPGVEGVHDLRVRWLGHRLQADLHITADGDLPTRETHLIAEEVRHALLHAQPQLAAISIHVDPREVNGESHHDLTRHHLPRSIKDRRDGHVRPG